MPASSALRSVPSRFNSAKSGVAMQRLLLPFHTFQIQPKDRSCRLSCLFQVFVGKHWCNTSDAQIRDKKRLEQVQPGRRCFYPIPGICGDPSALYAQLNCQNRDKKTLRSFDIVPNSANFQAFNQFFSCCVSNTLMLASRAKICAGLSIRSGTIANALWH